jgi:hypothetical protein
VDFVTLFYLRNFSQIFRFILFYFILSVYQSICLIIVSTRQMKHRDNIADLRSGSTRFKSQSMHLLSWLGCNGFLNSFRQYTD